jgi:hypothetical protein
MLLTIPRYGTLLNLNSGFMEYKPVRHKSTKYFNLSKNKETYPVKHVLIYNIFYSLFVWIREFTKFTLIFLPAPRNTKCSTIISILLGAHESFWAIKGTSHKKNLRGKSSPLSSSISDATHTYEYRYVYPVYLSNGGAICNKDILVSIEYNNTTT